MIKPEDSMPDVSRVRINLNADGTLHLVTVRSAFHQKLAAILAAPDAPAGEYRPSTYGTL